MHFAVVLPQTIPGSAWRTGAHWIVSPLIAGTGCTQRFAVDRRLTAFCLAPCHTPPRSASMPRVRGPTPFCLAPYHTPLLVGAPPGRRYTHRDWRHTHCGWCISGRRRPRRCLTSRRPHCVVPPYTVSAALPGAACIRQQAASPSSLPGIATPGVVPPQTVSATLLGAACIRQQPASPSPMPDIATPASCRVAPDRQRRTARCRVHS